MSRPRIRSSGVDVTSWPSVDRNALSADIKVIFEQHLEALERYLAGGSVRQIFAETEIRPQQLYRLLKRCLTRHDDGRVFGYRGLLPHVHVNAYTRHREVSKLGNAGSRGTAGAFRQLLEQHSALEDWIDLQIRGHRLVLKQHQVEDRLRTRLIGIGALHIDFIQQCRKQGLSASDYPLNAIRKGRGALTACVKAQMLSGFTEGARAAGAKHLKGLPRQYELSAPTPTHPMEVVEFDAHRLDLRLKIVVQDPLGYEQAFEIERVWLLVILDVYSRAVLGYHLTLAPEYSRYDVIRTIEKTLEPHAAMTFTLPGVGYGADAGFPSQRFMELSYATWQWFKLDNAKANLAEDTVQALCEFVGCFVNAGPTYTPDDRPYIERFFGTLAQGFSARLPGYVGNGPKDLRRALSITNGDIRLFLSITELEQLMEASMASYNATPHSGLHGHTPLAVVEQSLRGRGAVLNWLPERKRRAMYLMQTPKRTRVRGYLAQGIRPHVTFYQVRYTNAVLAASAIWIGKEIRLYYNSQDLRTVRAFLADGTEIGVLKAQGAWGEYPHDLALRRAIMTATGRKRFGRVLEDSFLSDYVEHKRKQAKRSRRAASDMARTLRALADAPTALSAISPTVPNTLAPTPAPEGVVATQPPQPSAPQRIEPIKLRIGSGYVS